ncbi:C2 domain protein [Dictyocaulus viviparus]|uniref:C2 domain protein n=1 Tax=Dictyocaulus viviparus TaxID=29172 RepID=A0A0D8Y1V2_DICVI|nr:C2 domain protein [Dictyocaulus viviparus]
MIPIQMALFITETKHLGIRVIGGKRMPSGELGAFVSAVNQAKYNQILGEVKEDISPDQAPPVPMHRRNGRDSIHFQASNPNRIYDNNSFGYLQIAISYDRNTSRLIVRIMAARELKMRDPVKRVAPNPFVKIYLLPVRKVSNKRRTRFVPCSTNPEWNQIVEYHVSPAMLSSLYLEFSVWDYDRLTENTSLGQVIVTLSDRSIISGQPFWLALQDLTNSRAIRSNLNAPIDDERLQVYNYNSALLDVGYPAIN